MRTCKVCGKIKEDTDFYGKIYTCKRCVCERNSRVVYNRYLSLEPPLEGEIWKPYPLDKRYLISNIGRVRGMYGKLLIPKEHRQGYLWLRIGNKHCLVHRLVAETYIPNPENKATVNHINANKADNRVENLEWATQSENNIHAFKNGLRYFTKNMMDARVNSRTISDEQVAYIRNEYNSGRKQSEIADGMGISRCEVCRIVHNKVRRNKEI